MMHFTVCCCHAYDLLCFKMFFCMFKTLMVITYIYYGMLDVRGIPKRTRG